MRLIADMSSIMAVTFKKEMLNKAQKSRAFLAPTLAEGKHRYSTNEEKTLTWLNAHFPALGADCTFLRRALIGLLCFNMIGQM